MSSNNWTEADWRDMHETMEAFKERVRKRHEHCNDHTHSSDGIRITYQGRIEAFSNAVYLGEAYARQMEVIDSLESHLSTASEAARMANGAMSDIAAILGNYKKDGDMMIESDIKELKRIVSQWDMPF